MFRFKMLGAALIALCLSTFSNAQAAGTPSVGVVNFKVCIEDSRMGKQEHSAFEEMKKEVTQKLQTREKELSELAAKLQDADYMDTLKPEAEAELKHKFRNLSQEMGAFQNRYYQELQQANYRVLQSLSEVAAKASEKVAKDMKLEMIVNDDNCFFYTPGLDVTTRVVAEMDRMFDQKKKGA